MTDNFRKIVYCLLRMQWEFMPVRLSQPSENNVCDEAVFLFDMNKLCYVCYLDKMELESLTGLNKILIERRDSVIREATEFSKQMLGVESFEFLTLYVIYDYTAPWLNELPKPDKNSVGIFFDVDELNYIANYENSDPLILWKFSEAYTELINECDVKSEGGNLAIFEAYKQNEDCIWPRGKERPELAVFTSRLAERYIQRSKKKRNEHLVQLNINGNIENIAVYNYCDYAPFYREIGDVNNGTILLEDFPRSIWFINEQVETHHPQFISSQLEMFAFWLMVLASDIDENFDFLLTNNPLVIKVILDQRYKIEMRPGDISPGVPLKSINIPVVVDASGIGITIPLEMASWYAKPDNQGERHVIFNLLKKILKAKNGNTTERLEQIIDERIPIGKAKMSTILTNANGILLETRFLPPYRKIQQYDLSDIRINLTRKYQITFDDSKFKTTTDRKKLCGEIAKVLHDKLISELKEYDAMMLLPFMLNGHEACVQKKAIQPLDRPARTATIGSDPSFILKEFTEEQDRIKTALALRCLIEFVTAYNTVEGEREPNFDDLDYLIALMTEMIAWANLSDGIHLGLYDPSMSLLPCGRIYVDYESINSKMFKFGFTKTEIALNQFDNAYEELLNGPDTSGAESESSEIAAINSAFHRELGLSLFKLHDFLTDLVNIARSNNASTVNMEEGILFGMLKETKFKWTDNEIKIALEIFSLLQGWKIDSPPEGYRNKDTRPWHYNRALSFLRRPIAKLSKNGITYYLWSYRHLFAAFENMCVLLLDGVLWQPGNGPISQIVTKYANKKGDFFRARVYGWLKENSDFEIREEEVPVKPKAVLNAQTDLGDVDIFAIDHLNKTIFAIECKNTSESKSVHDFKTDLDQYAKPNGKGYIEKHKKRHDWLKANPDKLEYYVKSSNEYKVVSVMITAFEMPLTYMQTSSIPFVSFPKLQMEGIKALMDLRDIEPPQ